MNNQQLFGDLYLISNRYKNFYDNFQKIVEILSKIPALRPVFDFIKCSSSTFADGELRFELNATNIRNNVVRVVHPLIDDTSVLELIFILDTLNRNSLCKSIQLVIPYMRYSRQNRRVNGEPMSANCIIKMILSHSEKLDSIEFFDLHDDSLLNVIPNSIHTSNQNYDDLFHLCIDRFHTFNDLISIDENTVVVAPDIGAVKRARNFANIIDSIFDIAIIDKTRNPDGKSQINNIVGQDVNDQECVIVDDIVDSAGTLCQTAKLLKEKGATKVYACISHGVFSGDAIQRIEDSDIERLFVTDSNKFDIKDSTKIEVIPFFIHEITNPCMTLGVVLEIYYREL